jgi:7-cyano-7-deazaguanine reductase
MSKKMKSSKNLSALGKKTVYTFDKPAPELLESFSNQHPENLYVINLHCNEFTSLCPVTGQPDWGKFIVRYVPDKLCVESKSLKLYLFSFRNHGEFHEDVTNRIAKDLFKLMKPRYLQIYGEFNSRGGIAIHPFVALWGKVTPKTSDEIQKLLATASQA